MHSIIILRDVNNYQVNFFRLKLKTAKKALEKLVEFYATNKGTKWIYEDVEKSAKIEIFYTDYETNENNKTLEISIEEFKKMIENKVA